jgi:hypothetical protein
MGIAAGSLNLPSLMQQAPTNDPAKDAAHSGQDLVATLEGLKHALVAGLIDQADFDAAKAKALGLS